MRGEAIASLPAMAGADLPYRARPLRCHVVAWPKAATWRFLVWALKPSAADLGRRFLGTVTNPADGGEMVRLEGRAGLGIPGPLLDLTLYSRHEGQLLRTLVNTRGGARLACGGSMRLTVNTGTAHPMAVRLDTLGLQGAQPWCVAYSNRLQLRLNAGAPVPNGQPSMEPSSQVSQQVCQW